MKKLILIFAGLSSVDVIGQILPTKAQHIIPVKMVRMTAPPSEYRMGDLFVKYYYNEKPVHGVILKPFLIDKYETTFAEYDQFCDSTGYKKPDDEGWGRRDRPVINVSWLDAVAYANWRSKVDNKEPCYKVEATKVTCNWNSNGYRLPTEAEWEYAASWNPNTSQKTCFGNGLDIADPVEINFNGTECASSQKAFCRAGQNREQTIAVGSFSPNGQGLYDMAGNVWEWCWDWYGEIYTNVVAVNPTGAFVGRDRVVRGGAWNNDFVYCRASARQFSHPMQRSNRVGFRLVCLLQ